VIERAVSSFGTMGSQVQILPLRPVGALECAQQPPFSGFLPDAEELQWAEAAQKRLDARKGENPRTWARKLGAVLSTYDD
jgi:hypothetical protein